MRNSLHPADNTTIDAWVDRMKYWLEKGMEKLYFFMHMHDEATSPELTVYLIDKMNREYELNLIKPIVIDLKDYPATKVNPEQKDCLINALQIIHSTGWYTGH